MGSTTSCFGDQVMTDEEKLERYKYENIKKVLLLGSAGSGKSTVLKQLWLIYARTWTVHERKDWIENIHRQILTEMQKAIAVYIGYHHRIAQNNNRKLHNVPLGGLTEVREDDLEIWDNIKLKCELLDKAALDNANKIYNTRGNRLAPETITAIKELWQQPVIKEIYAQRNITCIEQTSAYFWDMLDEIEKNDYLPTINDVMLCRRKTTAVREKHLIIRGQEIHIIDVGGQKSERRKWIHCFDSVTAILFVASLSCYDEILEEEDTAMQNSMCDQLRLFEKVVNNLAVKHVSKVLFLNKNDLFHQKYTVDKVPLSVCSGFGDAPDPNWSGTKAKAYIAQVFKAFDREQTSQIYTHITTATDKNNIKKVFGDVQEIIVSSYLTEAGFIDE